MRDSSLQTGENLTPAMLVVVMHALRVSAPTASEEPRFRSLVGQKANEFLWCPADQADAQGSNSWHQLRLGDQHFILSGSPLGSSYAINGALSGFDHRREDRSHLRGLVTKLRSPSVVALLIEASQNSGVMAWRVADSASGEKITLGNGLDGSMLASGSQIPVDRHRRRINIAYADGHVENLGPTAESLRAVVLAEGGSN